MAAGFWGCLDSCVITVSGRKMLTAACMYVCKYVCMYVGVCVGVGDRGVCVWLWCVCMYVFMYIYINNIGFRPI